ncbi:MAG TPA: condensation domain-containing protein [Anaerolineae bacterium]
MNRKYSDAERVVWLIDRVDCLNAGVVARINGRLDEQPVRIALNWLQKRHSMLRTRVDILGGRTPVAPAAEAIPPIQLRIEKRAANDQWETEANCELDQPMAGARGPLISIVLLQSDEVCDLIVTLHHVLGDTASVLYLMRDLLGLIVQVLKGSHVPSLQIYPERRAMDDLPVGNAKLMSSLMDTTAQLVTQVANTIQQREQKPAPKRTHARHALPKPSSPRYGDALHQSGCARMLHYVLSVDETNALARKCQAENTTQHGAICAAVLQTAGQHISTSAGRCGAAVPVSCLSSPRLHRALPARDAEEIGLFVPMVTSANYIGKHARFWDIARNTETTVQCALNQDDPLMAVPLPRELLQRVSEPYSGVVLVTNMGRLGYPNPYGSIMPLETRAAGAATSMADCFAVVTNPLPNRLLLSFFYPEGALSDDSVSLLGAAVIKNLRIAINAN